MATESRYKGTTVQSLWGSWQTAARVGPLAVTTPWTALSRLAVGKPVQRGSGSLGDVGIGRSLPYAFKRLSRFRVADLFQNIDRAKLPDDVLLVSGKNILHALAHIQRRIAGQHFPQARFGCRSQSV